MKNRRIKHYVSAMALAVMLSAGSGGLAHAAEAFPQMMDGVTEKEVGDRFSITEFNDIWRFIRGIFIGDNDTPLDATDDYRYGLGAEPRIIDTQNVTFDIGAHATIPGVLAADQICDDTSCSSVTSVLNATAGGGIGEFVDVTNSTNVLNLPGSATSSMDASGKTTGKLLYDADGVGAGVELTGYAAGNAICQAVLGDASAHVCSEDEIVLTINSNVSAFSSFTIKTFGWVTGGGSKYTSGTPVDDCNAFTYGEIVDDPVAHVGNIWKLEVGGGTGSAQPCTVSTQIACCI